MSLGTDTLQDKIGLWVTLVEQKRALEAELRPVQDQLNKLEAELLDDFADAGIQSVNAHGMTVYLNREFSAKLKEGVDKEDAIAAFERAGMKGCFNLAWQTMRGIVREYQERGEALPPEVAAVVDVSDFYRLRSRKA